MFKVGHEASIWHGVVIKGDHTYARIGSWTNIQDDTVIAEYLKEASPNNNGSVIIGNYVTVSVTKTRSCCLSNSCRSATAVISLLPRLKTSVLLGPSPLYVLILPWRLDRNWEQVLCSTLAKLCPPDRYATSRP